MACAGRMSVVEFELNAGMLEGVAAQDESRLTNVRKDDGKAPRQDAHVECAISIDDFRKESMQGQVAPSQPGKEGHTAIKIPPQDRNQSSRLADGFRQCSIIVEPSTSSPNRLAFTIFE